MHSFREEDLIGGGTIFKSVTRRDMESLEIVWPGKDLAGRFVQLADPAWQLIQLLTQAVTTMLATRDLLLPRLISGDIDVDDMIIDVSDAA